MAKIMRDDCTQYPLGATNLGVNQYEFVLDSQDPAQLSWPHPGNLSVLNRNNLSPPPGLSSLDPVWYPDALGVVANPAGVGSQCFRHYLPVDDSKLYVAGRGRAQIIRSSNAGVFADQDWFTKRFYAFSLYFKTGEFKAQFLDTLGLQFGCISLHGVGTPNGFSGAIPVSFRINKQLEIIIRNDNGYSSARFDTNIGAINFDEWTNFIYEVFWDPFNAGDPSAPPGKGGAGYLKIYKNQSLVLSNANRAQGFYQDYQAGFRAPYWVVGISGLPSINSSFWPITMYTKHLAVGDAAETVQSMDPLGGPPNPKLATLGFSPTPGPYTVPLTVTLTGINNVVADSPTTGANALYSINGAAYQAYTGSISLSTSGTKSIAAYQEKAGFDTSEIASGAYDMSQPQLAIPIRIESGKSTGMVPAGWTNDAFYSGVGQTETTVPNTILGLPSGYVQSLFQSIRGAWGASGQLRYDIPAPNGVFECRLLLCELNATANRRYKVKLQGEGTAGAWKKLETEDEYTVLSPLTIVGRYTALVVFRPVTIANGSLSLEWEYHDDTGGLTVVGIELLNAGPPPGQIAVDVLI